VAGHGGAVAACGAARLGVLHGAREGRRPRAYKSAAPAARSEEGMGDRGGQLGYGVGQAGSARTTAARRSRCGQGPPRRACTSGRGKCIGKARAAHGPRHVRGGARGGAGWTAE
jgi:hypothetical protein